MIAWSIEAAHQSNCFDRVIVSTDDEEIARIASDRGAEVPFLRPARLSDDQASTQAVILHALEWIQQQGQACDALCCLYATAPFVKSTDLLSGRRMLEKINKESFVFAATKYPFPIQRAIRINSSGISKMINPEHFFTRSQDLEETYHDAGQFYWGSYQAWLDNGNLFEGSLPIVLPRWRVQDIDTEDDWIRAELLKKLFLMNPNLFSL